MVNKKYKEIILSESIRGFLILSYLFQLFMQGFLQYLQHPLLKKYCLTYLVHLFVRKNNLAMDNTSFQIFHNHN